MSTRYDSKDQSGPIGNPNDPWSLTSDSYSPDSFFTRATDGNGHDTVMSLKVSPALMGEIQRLVQSRIIPQYRTHSDLVRDALIHRLRYLADEFDGSVDLSALVVEQRQAEIDRMASQRASWRKLIADLEAQLDDLIGQNELDEAEWLIEQNEWLDAMTPSYLIRLTRMLGKARRRISEARRDALDVQARRQ